MLATTAYAAEDIPAIVRAGFEAYSAKGAEAAWNAWRIEGAQKGIGQKEQWTSEDKAKFVSTVSEAEKSYGRSLGFEVIRSFEAAASYKTVYVLWRFERKPLFCMFVCYRAQDDWRVLNFFMSSDPRAILPAAISGMPEPHQ